MEFQTSIGNFTIELYFLHAPLTCQNLVLLASSSYYDNSPIHRVVRDFMVQMGDPTGTGRGGVSAVGPSGGPFPDELSREVKHVGAGVVSMANSGPNTNKSQFFVTLAPSPHLDGKHTVFGRIKEGMGTVQRLGLLRTGKDDRPIDDVRILSTKCMDEEGNVVDSRGRRS